MSQFPDEQLVHNPSHSLWQSMFKCSTPAWWAANSCSTRVIEQDRTLRAQALGVYTSTGFADQVNGLDFGQSYAYWG